MCIAFYILSKVLQSLKFFPSLLFCYFDPPFVRPPSLPPLSQPLFLGFVVELEVRVPFFHVNIRLFNLINNTRITNKKHYFYSSQVTKKEEKEDQNSDAHNLICFPKIKSNIIVYQLLVSLSLFFFSFFKCSVWFPALLRKFRLCYGVWLLGNYKNMNWILQNFCQETSLYGCFGIMRSGLRKLGVFISFFYVGDRQEVWIEEK